MVGRGEFSTTVMAHDSLEAVWSSRLSYHVENLLAAGNFFARPLEGLHELKQELELRLAEIGFERAFSVNHRTLGSGCCGAGSKLMMRLKNTQPGQPDGVVATIEPFDDAISFNVFAMDQKTADMLIKKLSEDLPVLRPGEDPSEVEFGFWRLGPSNRIIQSNRLLSCPALEGLEGNYDPELFAHLGELADMDDPWEHGRLLLWNGPPGTGKTFAIRALARAWAQKGASVEVVLDAEEMFKSSQYLYEVMLSELPQREQMKTELVDQGGARPAGRLIIVEDGEQLFADRKKFTGFSRLLNMTDGIIGQGLRAVVLFSTNEELERIDEALLRPGRCLAHKVFSGLSKDRAETWLENHGLDKRLAKDGQLLAELYKIKAEALQSRRSS